MRSVVGLSLLFLWIGGPGWARAEYEPVEIPPWSREGLCLNVWAERYEGTEYPTYRPAAHLEPNTNYLLVADLATLCYSDSVTSGHLVSVPLPETLALLEWHADASWEDISRSDKTRLRDSIIQLVVEDDSYRPPTTASSSTCTGIELSIWMGTTNR